MIKLLTVPLLLSALVLLPVSAQQRVLVSPYGDAFPIGKGQAAAEIMKKAMARQVASRSMVCDDKATFGYSIDDYPNPETNHIGFHQDIIAMWYVAPASGTIDTVFWWASDVGSLDSTVTLRLFESNIFPGSGPGYDGYPKPGRLCWGYYINTNDPDNGIAAFPGDATDPTWYSTVSGAIPSFTPTGAEIWGFGGFPVKEEANAINFASLDVLTKPSITVGDPFFITVRIYGPHVPQAEEDPTGFLATNEADSLATHNWKFYEHIVEIQTGFTCPGWVARGDFNILFWYSMTVSSNLPPQILEQTDVPYTFDAEEEHPITAILEDCNPDNPGNAGVQSAVVRYSVDNGPAVDVGMTDLGGDTWEATIPALPHGSYVSWRIVATDIDGAVGQGPTDFFRVVSYGTEWISVEQPVTCAWKDISGTGTEIDTSKFFLTPTSANIAPKDDGTAGPYPLGKEFPLFNDTYQYAWVGVNGALALSKTIDDTIDVNSDGYWTPSWDIPGRQHHGRADTLGVNRLPKMAIMPYWADHVLADTGSAGTKFGRLLYEDDYPGDTCLFIVQWDSMAAFNDDGDPIQDVTTFRAILNRCNGVVEFQYEDVGTTGLDSAALIGMQQDSTLLSGPIPGWVLLNRNGEPANSIPTSNSCVRLYPRVFGRTVADGWNLVGLSVSPVDGNYTKAFHFPEAISAAYRYAGGYVVADPMVQAEGYWMKFDAAQTIGAKGYKDNEVVAPVVDKWNIVSGPSGSVPVGSIGVSGGTVGSPYYLYNNGYFTATAIEPGQGYWVKMNGAGSLTMTSTGAVPKVAAERLGQTEVAGLNKIVVRDAAGRSQVLYVGAEGRVVEEPGFFEMPPAPPTGSYDVRFSSNRMLETYPDAPEAGRSYNFPMTIQGAQYPITVHWEINAPAQGSKKLVLADLAKEKSVLQVMEGVGSITIKSASATLGLSLSDGVGMPSTFALSQNYPNPFNPVTYFKVDLPKATEVEVTVYDLLGRKVASVLSGERAAGQYTLEWNGRDDNGAVAPTGMYFLRMTADEFTATQKIMLMK